MPPPGGEADSSSRDASASTSSAAHALVLEHVHPATRLMEKRRQTFDAQAQLDAQRAAFEEKEKGFAEREAIIKRKDLELQENLVRFGKFLQENDGKRARAKRRAADEAQSRLRKEAEIETLAERLRAARVRDETASAEVSKNGRYASYLESVLEHVSGDPEALSGFTEVEDILARHATLAATNADLIRAHRSFANESERVRAETAAYVEEKKDEALTLNNEIARLKKTLEHTTLLKQETARARDGKLKTEATRKMEHGRVCFATEHLFRRVRSRSAVKYAADENPLERLRVIGEYMSDLDAIVKQRHKENPGLTD